ARVFLQDLAEKQGDLAVAANPAVRDAARALAQKHGPQIENLQPGEKGVARLAAESAVRAGNHVKTGAGALPLTMENLVEGSRIGKGTFHLRQPRLETVDGAKNWTARTALAEGKAEKY